jgi:hypothetical protein
VREEKIREKEKRGGREEGRRRERASSMQSLTSLQSNLEN